jgi:hypothetical protein
MVVCQPLLGSSFSELFVQVSIFATSLADSPQKTGQVEDQLSGEK